MADYPKTTRIKLKLGLLIVDTDLTVYDDNPDRTWPLFHLSVVDPEMNFKFIKRSESEPFGLADGSTPNKSESELLSQLDILYRTNKSLFEYP